MSEDNLKTIQRLSFGREAHNLPSGETVGVTYRWRARETRNRMKARSEVRNEIPSIYSAFQCTSQYIPCDKACEYLATASITSRVDGLDDVVQSRVYPSTVQMESKPD